ncbi:MAG: VCBS repeat-containing protein [Candidatus Kapabacteria bacterium]|nr:VCBS repeat-containing protein [Candidatus Kapabacteria bacterium]MCS7169449.1 VCBS repeat-containing protein [Candidatus Kapabacteria bacterium]MDW7997011.1 VCBS repeat-containing protein [Bacteroidota bacterium]MDW8224949.1 VCBS repeat-containing protein [Bacteroidota bacterium]
MERWYVVLALWNGVVWSQVPYDRNPQWESAPQGFYATGLALADMDGDVFPELVVSCGNDMARQPVCLYSNQAGQLQQLPSWCSADSGYHGHLAVADVDGDGWLDVAVTEYLGAGGFGSPGGVKLYRNHYGRLEPLPGWRARESFPSFRCAWGDVDGDGRPDLAVAGGEAYTRVPEPVRVYRNYGGVLEQSASWQSLDSVYAYDLAWEDFNGDGWLDLAVACARGPSRVYYNRGGSLERRPGWMAAEAEFANSLAVGDVDGDGWIDVAVSFNRQLGGSGRFVLFRNQTGKLERTPLWRSSFSGYGSGIALVDVDGDGALDLVTGAWWDTVRIYRNLGGTLPSEPHWRSRTRSVVEAFAFADVNGDGLREVLWSLYRIGEGSLFRLPVRPVERLLELRMGGASLPPNRYCSNLATGWLSLPRNLGDTLVVRAVVSNRLDMAVSNWDPEQGNFLFAWQGSETGVPAQIQRLLLRIHSDGAGNVVAECCVPEAGMVTAEWMTLLGQSLPAFSGHLPAGCSRFELSPPSAAGWHGLRLHTPAGRVLMPLFRLYSP